MWHLAKAARNVLHISSRARLSRCVCLMWLYVCVCVRGSVSGCAPSERSYLNVLRLRFIWVYSKNICVCLYKYVCMGVCVCVHVRLTLDGGETELCVCVCVQGIKVGWSGGKRCTRPRTRIWFLLLLFCPSFHINVCVSLYLFRGKSKKIRKMKQ